MSIQWDKYHVGFDGYHNRLFIGRVINKDGKVRFDSKSEDRTEEIITTVMQRMKACVEAENDPNKPYKGYQIKGVGQLLFIDDNYTYEIKPKPRIKK